jgi:DNA-binding response OmpR family regulator
VRSSGLTLRVDADARRVFADGAEIEMGAKEFDLLRLLSAHRDEVVARDRLTAAAWSEHWYGSRKTLDVTIARLRQKLAEAGITDRIAAVRGVGFRLETTTD